MERIHEKAITSATNTKWQKKRIEAYNDRVWRGWRVTDGLEAPVTIYKMEKDKD